MQYQIDQSGKIERTSKTTVIAYANGSVRSLKISAVEKQKLMQAMKVENHPKKLYIYKIFAGLIFLLLKNTNAQFLIIDKEYPGHNGIIKDVLIGLYRKHRKIIPEVSFAEIGKKSNAHIAALDVFRGARTPDITIKAKDILRLFYAA